MTAKITVSLPDHLVAAARQAVADGMAASVSAYVARALEAIQPPTSWEELMADMDAEFGPVPEETKRWADAELARARREWQELKRGR